MVRRFRIHPAIGVARVGNSPDEFFVGPEQPSVPANWKGGKFESFRDKGQIKREAARFRVFEYVDDGAGGLKSIELTLGGAVVDIEWRVHIANRKGSFFSFDGQRGADDIYVKRASKTKQLRNASVSAERRHELDIDPGEKLVSVKSPGPVKLENPNQLVPIPDLGEIRVDEAGRLLVLGGHGITKSNGNPIPDIKDYANNDTWFDDVGDGSVKARIQLADGTHVDADAAWVIVGPPDFSPSVSQAVSLFDLMWDLAVRVLPLPSDKAFRHEELSQLLKQKEIWASNGGTLKGYVPSFLNEIYPILSRAVAVRGLHKGQPTEQNFHKQLMSWVLISSKDQSNPHNPARFRREMMGWIRNPDAKTIDWKGMPRGLGDDYGSLDSGDPKPTALFSLTRVQYALLEEWASGNFVDDWPGKEPGIPEPAEPTPAGLDRAALENCVGGPFFPGIEVSWLIRIPQLYVEPFRLDVPSIPIEEAAAPKNHGAITFRPGFFSQQMAQPWQADFHDCQKEEKEGPDNTMYFYMWWTAQRPDDTFAPGAATSAPWVRHIVPPGVSFEKVEASDDRFKLMVENWPKLPFVLPKDLPNGERRLEEQVIDDN